MLRPLQKIIVIAALLPLLHAFGAQKKVTYDLERQMEGATKVSTSEFGRAIVENV